jgi:hypothetical protein
MLWTGPSAFRDAYLTSDCLHLAGEALLPIFVDVNLAETARYYSTHRVGSPTPTLYPSPNHALLSDGVPDRAAHLRDRAVEGARHQLFLMSQGVCIIFSLPTANTNSYLYDQGDHGVSPRH